MIASLGVPSRAIAGIPDLMHHKYAVRDEEMVFSGALERLRVRVNHRSEEAQLANYNTANAGAFLEVTRTQHEQRAFPLVFRRLLRDADSANAGPDFQARRQRDSLLLRSLSEQESDSGWKSRIAVAGPYGPVYPKQLRIAGEGGYVVSQFIVDSTGKTRPDSWHAIDATNVDFAKAVAASVPQWRWKPARNRGQPVCELGLDFITFHTEYGSGWNVGHVIIYR